MSERLVAGRRRRVVMLIDAILFVIAYAGADFIRLDLLITNAAWHQFGRTVLPVIILKAAIFYLGGTYRGLIFYATLRDVAVIVRNSTLATVGVAVLFNLVPAFRPFSRGVLIIDWMLTILLVCASRVTWRLAREGALSLRRPDPNSMKRILIVGAGRAGVALAKELMTRQRGEMEIVGFVDDDPEKQGSTLLGRPILGAIKDLPEVARRRPVDRIIVAIPSAPPKLLRRIGELASNVAEFSVVPPLEALLRGRASIVQAVPVPEETFLGRDAVDLAATEALSFFADKVVLVTGAGGSIGGELARQIAQGPVKRLLLLDCAETPLYDIHRQTSATLGARAVPLLASVRDYAAMAEIIDSETPDVILHAAALKHVPMCEEHPLEALATNTCATARLADLAHDRGVSNFTLVSTDKAVAPSCVMGATKRAAENYVQSLAHLSATRFAAVRFGNVLGSNGSVLPLFHEQINAGGPVTVTHPEATRFFMTIPEACGLILQATCVADGAEVYVLDMGEPVRVLEMAENLIRLYGYEPGKDIEIKIIGLRDGEKLHETLVDADEEAEPMGYAKLLRIRGPRPERPRCKDLVDTLERAVRNRDVDQSRSLLLKLVPTFRPEEWRKARIAASIPRERVAQ